MQATSILALDVGEKRIGIAITNSIARLPRPLTTIVNDETVWDILRGLIEQESVSQLVVGLPRNLSGDDTKQTIFTRRFVEVLQAQIDLPITLQDEALTSKKAEEELAKRKKPFQKADIDAMAATYILEDFLNIKTVSS